MRHTDEELLRYLDGELRAPERDAINRALDEDRKGDGALALRLAHLQETAAMVRNLDAEDAQVDVAKSWNAFSERLDAQERERGSAISSATNEPKNVLPFAKRAAAPLPGVSQPRTVVAVSLGLAFAAGVFLWLRGGNQTTSSEVADNQGVTPADRSVAQEAAGTNDETLAPATLADPEDEAVAARRVEVLALDPGNEKSNVIELFDDGQASTVIWISDHAPN